MEKEHKVTFTNGKRIDGRAVDELRNIKIEVGVFKSKQMAHLILNGAEIRFIVPFMAQEKLTPDFFKNQTGPY